MSGTLELRKIITRELKQYCTNVYYEEATNDTSFPYIVYSLESLRIDGFTNYNLEINVYDNSISTTVIEEIADNVEKLDETSIYYEGNHIAIYLNKRNSIYGEKGIKRRRLLFDLS